MIGLLFLILIIFLIFYASFRISEIKLRKEKVSYEFLEVKEPCKLHSWEIVKELNIMRCKECRYIAGSDTSNTEEVE